MEQTNLSRYLMCSFAFVLLYPTAIDLYLVALPQIANDLSASESQLHIAFSIYLAGLASTMIFVGRAADYFGRKPVAMCGAVIFTLASMFAGSAETSDSFLIMRFFQGVGAACCYVVAFAILRDTLDEQKRAKVLSMLNGIICSIPVLALVVGNLIMIKFPWPVLFTAMAMMGITIGLIACFVLTKKAKRPLLDVSEDTNESLYNHFFISRVVYTSLGVAAILSYVNTSPMIVMDSIGFTRAEYSIAMALLAMVGMTTSFSVPFALSYFKQTTLMFTAQITTLLSASVILAAHLNGDSSTLYMVGFTLISMGFSMGFGVAMSQALSQSSRKAGLASSMLGIGQVSWSALYIWLMATLGVSAVMMLIIALVASGVIGLSIILLFPNHNVSEPHEEISCPT
ncbi:MFS transporter [Vibrio parahaemolyticus]|uniref:MFS transporter n=1 Tax=Vibrio parahaemolyticus TaxID=670 RepID=UPI000A37F700|nr:MFS transporter [Vibrio parahaemolyticus]OUD26273.1 multidrug transporter subunit MdtL [Vibrio parahaemolyticus]HCM1067417.1 MFS transporter [Vibrio parahaemolyticus]HCM1071706.1 MFS transporter [Vibrio parahaemolyticus]HCM1083338.1 MFS transporter [Vibrio parahaemolyticus]HCM1087523.1 MFS transporter [Vibrio parahaemolyticus]